MKAMLPGTQGRIKLEVKKEVDSYFLKRCLDMDTIVLWILHDSFGFGRNRLRRYFEGYITKVKQAQEAYGDVAYDKMREALTRIGVDIEEWEKEI